MKKTAHYLPALTGIRFFAVFHIFMFHLVATYFGVKGQGADILSSLDDAPVALLKLSINGWMSTSLFFLLSGFILAYLYWGEDGRIATRPRRFWTVRAVRIWPIHALVLLFLLVLKILAPPDSLPSMGVLVASFIATLALVQAWVPPLIPHWSWPTWTISVLAFLYLITPWLMRTLSRLSRRQMILALCAMPVVSLIPTGIYALRMAAGAEDSMYVDMVVANNPLFWVPYYAAGMLMTRVFSISRAQPPVQRPSWFSWGDAALIGILIVASSFWIDQPLKFALRQGLLMPLFMLIVLDLARGRGLMARVFSLPGMGWLGETAYSIFIWQAVILVSLRLSREALPWIGPYQLWLAMGGIVVLAVASTYLIEKPIAKAIGRKAGVGEPCDAGEASVGVR
jgi:peptidoglycan/LPS O-acetylase OafA/YrhL